MRLPSTDRRRHRRPAFELLEKRIVLDGELDSSFGTEGLVTTDILSRVDRVSAKAVQPDGKIVVAGSNGPTSGRQDFALVRYNANGTLDDGSASDSTPDDMFSSPFGGAGRVVTEMQVVGFDQISDLIIQPDGKIVVAGQATFSDLSILFAVLRYNEDGSHDDGGPLDTTPDDQFGIAGKVFVDFGFQYNLATAIVRQSNGKLVIAGQVKLNESDIGFGLVRLNSDGSLDDGSSSDGTPDDSFGVDGMATTTFGVTISGANDVVLQPDGKILAVGYASLSLFSSRFAVARYDLSGNLDTSFDGDGQALLNFGLIGPSAAVLQADGKLIVAGAQGQQSALGRINVDGSPDDGGPNDSTPSDHFATTGSLITNFPTRAEAVTLQADGKIVIAGSTGLAPNRDMALARYNSDGTLDDGGELDETPDDTFGVAGKVTTNFGGDSLTDDLSYALSMHTNGNLMVAGITGNDIAVARYHVALSDAVPDSDADGVPNEIENEAPNGGDGNHDGTLDVNQKHVASLPNAVDGSYVTFVAPEGTRLKNVRSRDVRSIHSATFPLGAFAFELADVGPDVTTVTLIPSTSVSPNCVFKFGPTSDDPVPHWYRFDRRPGASIGAELLADRVHLHLRDGDLGDDDRSANGVIVDDVAIAVDLADQVTVNGVVFHDVDGDGNFGGPFLNEAPLAGWTMYLDENANGLLDVDSTTSLPTEPFILTGETGTYGFEGLERRTYTVTQIPPPGWISTTRFISSTIPGGTVPRSVAAGDFNSDGRTDLAVVENFQVSLLLRREDGTYEAPVVISDASADAVVVGHFNGDTLPDIAIRGSMFVDVFLGLPSGEFTDLTAVTLDGGGPNLLVAADLDQDGDDDLVVNSSDRAITVVRNDGVSSGSFSKLPPVDIGDEIAGLSVGQLNLGTGPGQDAITDLAVSTSAGKIVNILNIGTVSQTVRETTVSGEPGNLVVGQFNGSTDDHADIAYVDRDARRVRVLFGDGAGAMELAPGDGHAVGEDPQSIQATDFNSDRVMDLSVVNTDSDDVSILTGVGNGMFLPELRINVGNSPLTQLAADVTGDGLPDLAVSNRASGTISILARDGAIGQSIKVRLGERPIVYDAHFANQPIRGGSIRGTRWDDLDGNGIREPSEPVRVGERVFLDVNQDGDITGGLDRAVATNDDGVYEFANMPPGEYHLIAELDPDSIQTFPDSGGYMLLLVEGRHVDELDFGSRLKPGTIRGFVWDDQNGNGVRDNADGDPFFDEPIQSDVTVFLDFNANGILDPDEPSRVTGLTGEFVFAELPAGRTYLVAEVVPSGFVQSFPGSGRPVAQQVDLAPDATVLTNFGNVPAAEVRGTKWTDTNGNGLPDDGEPRAAGVTVFVDLNENGALNVGEPRGVTDSDGVYVIGDIPPGTHTVTDEHFRSFGSGNPSLGQSFGFSVATVGRKIVVGDPQQLTSVPFPDITPDQLGMVYVIDPTDGTSIQLDQAGLLDDDLFGFSLATVGDFVAVGIPGMYIDDDRRGKVIVFNVNSGEVIDSAEVPRISFDYGNFGTSIAAVDADFFLGFDAFAVGAPGSQRESSPGLVGLLEPLGPTLNSSDLRWSHVVTEIAEGVDSHFGVVSSFNSDDPEDGVELNDFGESVAAVDNRIIVGDPSADEDPLDVGKVRILAAVDGELLLTIRNPMPDAGDDFGAAVSALGNDVLVGAPADDLGASNTGAVFLFDGSTGNLLQAFENPTPATDDRFGFAVISVGDYVVVGAPHDDSRGENAGAVYVFEGSTGRFVRAIFSPSQQAGAEFGFSLAMAGDHQVLVGAPSIADAEPGAAYLVNLGRQIAVLPGQTLERVDFPNVPPIEQQPAAIRGTLFDDSDGDGQVGSSETRLSGRTVFLDLNGDYEANPNEPTIQTDVAGQYEFSGLRPANYAVATEVPRGWTPTAPSGPSAFRFDLSRRIAVSDNAFTVVSGDLNGDSHLDLLVDLVGSESSILLADPASSSPFQPAASIPVGYSIRGAVIADFNADDLSDLVVLRDSSITILFNNVSAPGTFDLHLDVDIAPGVDTVAAGDWNADGLTDLAITSTEPSSPETNRLYVLINSLTQPGTFLPAVTYDVAHFPSDIAVGDWNGDGLTDLAVGESGARFIPLPVILPHVAVLLNNPASPGSFLPPANYTTERNVAEIETADVNRDGLLDLLWGGSSSIGVLLNRAAAPGQFDFGWQDYTSLVSYRGWEVADLGGDQLPDLVLATEDFGLVVLTNDPHSPGTFLEQFVHTPAAGVLNEILMLNLNNDGRPDFVATIFGEPGGNPPSIVVTTLELVYPAVSQTVVVGDHQIVSDVNFGSLQDRDADGVANETEALAPNSGDGNGDDVADVDQLHVASLPAAVGGGFLTLASASGTQLVDVSTFEKLAPSDPGPFAFFTPVGVVEFALERIPIGGAVNVELFLHATPIVDTYYKFGPTPGNPTPHLYEFLFDGTTGAEFFDASGIVVPPHSRGRVSRIVLHLREGGRGDDDPTPGRIHDPGAPAVDQVLPPPPSSPQIFASDTVVLGQNLSTLLAFTTLDDETFAAEIRWGDGLTESFPLNRDGVDAVVTTSHRFLEPGTYDVEATVQGTTGFHETAEHTVQVVTPDVVNAVQLVPDPAWPGRRTLIVGGTAQDDRLHVSLDATGTTMRSMLNDSVLGTFSADEIALVVVLGHSGHDTLEVDPSLIQEVVLVGGDGDDVLIAVPANTTILGGPGNDLFRVNASEFTLDLGKSVAPALATLETIDIADGIRNQVVLDAKLLTALGGSIGRFKFLASDDDILQLEGDFLLAAPVFDETEFFHVVTLNGTEIFLSGPHPWQNPVSRLDANTDTEVSPIDALVIINELNSTQSGPLPVPVPERAPPMYYDTNGDNFITPIDVLIVINFLNMNASAEGESIPHISVDSKTRSGPAVLLISSPDFDTTDRLASGGHEVVPARQVSHDASSDSPICLSRVSIAAPNLDETACSHEEEQENWESLWDVAAQWEFELLVDLVDQLALRIRSPLR